MANVISEWPEQRADGQYWVKRYDDGTYSDQKINNTPPGGGGDAAPSGGSQTYQTREGTKTVDQMRAELIAAGGSPPNDPEAVFQMYQNIGGGGPSDLARLLGIALPDTNQQYFDWSKEQFNRNLAEQIRQFDAQLQQQQQGQQSNLAQALLAGAASLRGPADWLRYAQYTTGGQNIFDRLYGDKPAPAFGAPTGYSQPATIEQLLRDLGLLGGGANPRDELVYALPAQGGGNDLANALQQATAPVTGAPTPGAQPQARQQAMAPLPHQVNPAVWDSLSNTAKQMILASVEAGNTASGAWDATDYLNQLNAARPTGTAPRRTTFSWGQPQSYF